MKLSHYLVFLFMCVAASDAHAAPAPAPTAAETRTLLLNSRFDELDAKYGAIQKSYESGEISDVDLRAAFRPFYDPSPALDQKYFEWVMHSPSSYVAHLARGIYHRFVGLEKRGDKFRGETSKEQLEGQRRQNAMAARELALSRDLTRKPLLTYLHSIDIEAARDGIPAARVLLDRAVKIDPKTFVVREKFMGALRTPWGGSTKLMKEFLAECRSAGLNTEQLHSLEALVLEDEAWVHRYREGDNDAAIDAYGKAAALSSTEACEPCGPLMKAASLATESGKFEKAVELYSQVLGKEPDSIAALNGRGFAHLQLSHGELAYADFLRGAKSGSAYAQRVLGKMLWRGDVVPADPKQAQMWMSKAAAQGDDEARGLLELMSGRAVSAVGKTKPCDACAPLMKAASSATKSEEYEKAVELYSQVLSKVPDSIAALNGRGFAHLQLKHGELAYADFLDSANFGNAYAQRMLGQMLWTGAVVPTDRKQAKVWMLKAATQGDEEAQGWMGMMSRPGR